MPACSNSLPPAQPSKRKTTRKPSQPSKRTTGKASRLPASPSTLPAELTTGLSLAQLGNSLARASCFLLTLFETGSHGKAIGRSGVGWGTLCRLRVSCPDFDALYRRVRVRIDLRRVEQARDALHERAVEGVLEPVYQGGRCVGTVRRYSDKLLETELKALDPGTFGPAEEAKGSGVRITINLIGVSDGKGGVSKGQTGDLTATMGTAKPVNHAQLADIAPVASVGCAGSQPATLPQHVPDAPAVPAPAIPAT